MRYALVLSWFLICLSSVSAEEVQVNQGQWDQLTDSQKSAIQNVIKQSFKGQNITIASTTTAPVPAGALGNLFGQEAVCKSFCDFSATLATMGCTGIAGAATAGVAGPLCGVVVGEAKKLCYKDCEK